MLCTRRQRFWITLIALSFWVEVVPVESFTVAPNRATVLTHSGAIGTFQRTVATPPPRRLLSLTSSSSPNDENSSKLPFLLDPGTKGGALFYMTALFVLPVVLYQILVATGRDAVETGILIGAGFTILSTLAWSSTYLFRVATKDMTYVSTTE